MIARVSGRFWLVILVVLGVTAGLLGAAPREASGEHGEDADVDFEAAYGACVGAALEPAGFEDTVGSFAEDEINCLGHYGITRGRTATSFAPAESVLRWQMALFLARAAGAAGIVLERPAQDQGFTDIAAVSEEARNAINGLAKAGIMPGTSATAFQPNIAVTRGSMADILDAFLSQARPGTGAFGMEADSYSEVKADNFQVFNDILNVSRVTYSAIYRIYEVGVTQGIGDHQYGPDRNVTRAQMAAFIMRTLAHTMARPAGVSVQAEKDSVLGSDNVELAVSVRDALFQPLVDAHVDVFRSTEPDDAFRSDGACDTGNVSKVGGVGVTACRVDNGDEQTDDNGDISSLSVDITDADVTLWAWTGDEGDDFDSDDTTSARLTVAFSKAASQLLVTDNLAEGQTHLPFGETVAVTVQVANEDDEPVAEKGVRVTVSQVTTPDTGTPAATTSATATYSTDAAGRFTLEFTQAEPSAGDDDDATVVLTLSRPSSYSLKGEDGQDFTGKTYTWSDDEGTPARLVLEQRFTFAEASDEGSGAGNSVTATLTDEFGNPMRGRTIHFWSDDPAGVGEKAEDDVVAAVRGTVELADQCASGSPPCNADSSWRGQHYLVLTDLVGEARYTRTTNRSGQAVLSYTRDASASVIETIRARLIRGIDDAKTSDADDPEDLMAERVDFYWYEELDEGDDAFGRILIKDADAKRLVIASDDGGVKMFVYDGNDQLNRAGVPAAASDFDKYLKDTAAHVSVSDYADSPAEVSKVDALPEWAGVDLSRIPVPTAVGRDAPALDWGMLKYASDGDTIAVGSFWENDFAGAVYVYNGPDDETPTRLAAPTPQPSPFAVIAADVAASAGSGATAAAKAATGSNSLVTAAADGTAAVATAAANAAVDAVLDSSKNDAAAKADADAAAQAAGASAAVAADAAATAVAVAKIAITAANAAAEAAAGEDAEKAAGDAIAAAAPYWAKPWTSRTPTASGGWFGWSVDIRGDTLVVGEPGRVNPDRVITTKGPTEDGPAADGRAYVYTRTGGEWTLDATLTAHGYTLGGGPIGGGWSRGMQFGRVVAVSGDETHIAVGSPGAFNQNHPYNRVGGVFMFSRPASAADGQWDDQGGAAASRLDLSRNYMDINANHNLGGIGFYPYNNRELAISRDGSTVASSSNLYNRRVDGVLYYWAGAAFVHTAPDGGWVANTSYEEDAVLFSPTPYSGEKVGRSVAVSDDGGTLVVSAGSRPNLMNVGKALVFERPDQTGRSAGDQWGDAPESANDFSQALPDAVLTPPTSHPDAPDDCAPPGGPVLGCNLGEAFGDWVDIIGDGSQILASRSSRTEGGARGSMHVFAEPAAGWSAVTAENQPSSVEYLGPAGKPFEEYPTHYDWTVRGGTEVDDDRISGVGFYNHFDQATGAIYTAHNNPTARLYRVTQVTP